MLVPNQQPKCAYCGKPIPQESAGPDTPWLMEKAGYGLRMIQWRPQSRPIWDLEAFYQLCSFACAQPMIEDFVRKERWRLAGLKTPKKEKVHP